MSPLMGTNKAAWGVKLLLTTVLFYQIDCVSFCALLKTWHCCLPPCGWCCLPPTPTPPHPTPSHPLYTSSLILQESITKTSSVSCVTELVIKTTTLPYLCYEFGVPTVGHQRARVPWIFKSGISRNIKYSIKLGFLRSSHTHNTHNNNNNFMM